MEHASHGRPPTRRRALGDATLRANEDHRSRSPRHGDKLSPQVISSSSPKPLPHNESLDPNGSLAVRHQSQPSPQHKRLSAMIHEECRPHNPKRDSQVSNASTNASNTSSRRKTHIGPWQLGKTIGRGGCSRVRIVRHSGTGQYGAAKIISKATADKVRALSLANLVQSAQHDPTLFPGGKVIPFGLEREICIMKLLKHPNIVHLYDIWENRNELYLIMEYVEGGELFSYMSEQGPLPEIQVVHIFRQIIAALLYCHRINIHHRDLKPENILLDRDTMQIKLVDFGMAALQPLGKKLTTPCGSPHYAAPEVIATKPYDGGKADIWSCGVILYVLLAGVPPFNYSGEEKDLRYLFRAISRADYTMPDGLSWEAKSLIGRILVPNPKSRISIDEIWNHPFMRKYGKELDFVGERASIEHWVGPMMSLEEWKPLSPTTIDREILRYMRTLWHSEKEQVLIQRLLNNEANYEKYFYTALQRYQHEQLENYVPSPHQAVTYSNSDHHHNGRLPPTENDLLQLPSKKHKRSQSGFSILNDEHLYSRHSFYDHPTSEASYDPFRASREPVIPTQDLHQNITVHRGPSSGSRKLRPATALGHRTGSSLRVQALRNSKRSSHVSRASSKRSTPSQRTASYRQGSMSRSSMASSHWPSSPPVIVRPGSFGKRGVSFAHLRRSSVATASPAAGTSVLQHTPERRYVTRCRDSAASSMLSPGPSTVGDSPTVIPLSKAAASPIVPRLRVRKPDSPSKYIQTEARKCSTELEKVMDEAFNRSSVSSSVRTSVTDPHKDLSGYNTPPTSISNRDSGGTTCLGTPDNKASFQNRPLPPIPNETPNTFLQRKLAETRAEIARRAEQGGDNTEHFNEVLEHLDLLMVPSTYAGKRTASAPTKSPEQIAPLHVIPEEVKADADDRFEPYSSGYRAVTDPIRPNLQGRRALTEQTTIRLVDQSPTRIAPLNIRKRSSAGTSTKCGTEGLTVTRPDSASQSAATTYHNSEHCNLAVRTNQTTSTNAALEVPEKKDATVKKKKSFWLRRNLEDKDKEKDRPLENQPKPGNSWLQIPEAWQGLDDRIKNDPPKTTGPSPEPGRNTAKQSNASTSSEFPMRNCGTAFSKSEGSSARKGFFGLFGKKSKEDKGKHPLELAENFSTSSILSNFDLEFDNAGEMSTRPSPPDFQTNWLSRFLHIKPASKILCFQVRRGKARQDLVRLLRDWQRFGVRDVNVDRTNNIINARIDKKNHLSIKPVTFVIELFVILEHGNRANLCLARFTQTRGAASSFRKTVEVIEDVCRNSSMLIEDEETKTAMCGVLS